MIITPNMSLFAWTSVDDDFDHTQLATNFQRADAHDHTPGKGTRLDGTAAIIPLSITDASIAEGTITGDKISAGTSLTLGSLVVDGPLTVNGANLSLNDGNFDLTVGSINMTNGNIGVALGSITLTNGNITMDSGDLTMDNGDLSISIGSLLMGNGNIDVTTGSLLMGNGNVIVGGAATFSGEGTFTGGVQSGDGSHANQVISYGGFTAEAFGLTLNNTGGITITNGDIDQAFGSYNMTNGNITITLGSIDMDNGNILIAQGGITTFNGNIGASGLGNFVGGVVSGSSSHFNQIITWGGLTSNGFGAHLAAVGSLTIDDGAVFFDGGTYYIEWVFDGTHNVILTNTFSYNTTSDARLKENVRDIEDPTAILKAIKGHRFEWKETGHTAVGFIAQEVKEILPEIVTDELPMTLGDGTIGAWHTLDRSHLIAPLWEASRAMLTRIEALESAKPAK